MTEREYQGILDIVEEAIGLPDYEMVCIDPGQATVAANDNAVEWPLTPFPEGWHASS